MTLDLKGTLNYINPVVESIGGYSRAELIGHRCFSFIRPDFRKTMAEFYERQLLQNIQNTYLEFPVVTKNGKTRWLGQNVQLIIDDGKVIGFHAIARDITERKIMENELQKKMEEISDLYNNAPCGYHSLAADGTFLLINNTELRWLGYNTDEVVGKKKFTDITTPASRQVFEQNFPIFKKQGWSNDLEFELVRKDGSIFTVLLNATAINDLEGNYIMSRSSIVDITARKVAEKNLITALRQLQETREMLIQTEKLAAIGRLSAGTAHEILNPVNILSMRLQLLAMTENLSPKDRQALQDCNIEIERVVKITKDLNQFSRVSPKHVTLSDLNEDVDHVLSFIKPRLGFEKVKLYCRYQNDLPLISIDTNRIQQVILNIISNALDAMEGKEEKKLFVTTKLDQAENIGEVVRIIVADSGTGVKREDVNKLFEPFFTTKEPGRGTGLGLAISYGIITDHGGNVIVEDNDMGGASFIVNLPVHYRDSKINNE